MQIPCEKEASRLRKSGKQHLQKRRKPPGEGTPSGKKKRNNTYVVYSKKEEKTIWYIQNTEKQNVSGKTEKK